MKERYFGIDFLRILSMFMVVVLHVLGKGGILETATDGSTNYWVAWFLEIASYCAVNCFALISGFVMLNSRTRASRIAGLWFQTAFYTVFFTTLLFALFPGAFRINDVVKAFFPITTNHYWYISAYFGMYILVPVLNAAVEKLKRKTLEIVFIGVLFGYCLLSLKYIPNFEYNPFVLESGYSVIWLCLLYLLGAYFKKYDIASKVKKSKAWGLYISMTFVTFVSKYVIETFTELTWQDEYYGNLLVNYASPTVLFAGVGLFLATAQLRFPKRVEEIISLLAPASLGVYLIHVCKPVWAIVLKGFSEDFAKNNVFMMVTMVIGCSIGIYVICTFIEILRQRIFKLLKVNTLCLKIEEITIKIFDKVYLKYNEDDCTVTK